MTRPRVLVSDPIAPEGLKLLETEADVDVRPGLSRGELSTLLPDYDALVVRSETKVTPEVIEKGNRLRVVGRAGVGVDNIDVPAATSRGIAVVNAPSGNIVAAAEHTVALILALARNVPQAHQSMAQGQWARREFIGVEVRGKTLGIVGLGRVGSEVARRAQSFGMRLLGYDPFVSAEYAASLGVEIMSMDALLSNSDFLTIHIPLTDTTRALIGEPEFKKMKPGARLINVARGGLVDEDALAEALEDGRLAGAALDVFAAEPPRESPLLGHPRVVVTPHLGGSTEEAQREVAVEVAEQVLAVLRGQPARTAVNAPFVSPEVNRVVAPFVPVAELVGKLVTHLAEGQFESIELGFEGEIAEHDTALLRAAALTGLLSPTTSERINEINANLTAQRRGLRVSERKGSRAQEYGSLLTLTLHTTLGDTTIAGTSMRGEPHVVRVNQYWLDLIPSVPYLVFIEHGDMPGMIGAVGTITGRNDVNIAFMEVGRLDIRGKAMMVLGLDDPVNARVLEEIKAVPHIDVAKVVRL